MTSSGISSNSAGYTIGTMQRNIKSFKENFLMLGQALKSGDLSAARQAFSSLQELLPASFGNRGQGGSENNACHSTFTTAFSALGDALNRGDLEKAKGAYLSLQQDAKSPSADRLQQPEHDLAASSAASARNASGTVFSISA